MLAAHEPQDTPAVGADSQEPSTRTFVSDMCRRGLLDVAASINVEEELHVNRFTVLAVAASIWGLRVGFETHDWRASRLTRSMTEAA